MNLVRCFLSTNTEIYCLIKLKSNILSKVTKKLRYHQFLRIITKFIIALIKPMFFNCVTRLVRVFSLYHKPELRSKEHWIGTFMDCFAWIAFTVCPFKIYANCMKSTTSVRCFCHLRVIPRHQYSIAIIQSRFIYVPQLIVQVNSLPCSPSLRIHLGQLVGLIERLLARDTSRIANPRLSSFV